MGKAAGDAHEPIMDRDVTGAENRREGAKHQLGKPAPHRLTGDNDTGVRAQPRTEFHKFRFRQMVKDQIANDGTVLVVMAECLQVCLVPRQCCRPIFWWRNEIQSIQLQACTTECQREFTRARANLEYAFICTDVSRQFTQNPAVVTHEPVDEAEVTATLDGVRMVWRKRIEKLGVDRPGHA